MRLKTHLKGILTGIGFTTGVLIAGGVQAQVASHDCKKADGNTGVITTLPYSITQSGTYCLDKNITISANNSAITIYASNVTVDLNSHSISGPRANGVPSIGATAGAGAVPFSFQNASHVNIRNGSISGMFAAAMFGTAGGSNPNKNIVFENLNISNMQYGGIVVSQNSRCDDCVVRNNILTRIDATLCTDCTNQTYVMPIAMWPGDRNKIIGNIISGMKEAPGGLGSTGISGGNKTLIEGNVIESESAAKLDTGVTCYSPPGLPTDVMIINNRMKNLRYGINFTYATGVYSGNMTVGTTTPYFGGGTSQGLNF